MVNRVSHEHSRFFTHLILWMVLLFLILFLVAAAFLKVDVVTKASGKVVPSKHVQIIENLEGGIVQKIYVKVGDIVKQNQILFQLDNIRFNSEYEEGLKKEIALQIKVASLSAIAFKKPFSIDPKLTKAEPELAASEKLYYLSKKQEIEALQGRLALLQKEVKLTEPLVKDGVMSTVELLRLQRDLEELQGNIASFNASVLKELNDVNDKLNQVQEENKANLDRLTRTTVRAPLYGVVKQVMITTEGGVIKPGDVLAEIVPLDDTLLIEALIRPSDIAFVHQDQPATVKITAYDYTIYGGLDGLVEKIASDTIKDEKTGETHYQIWVRTKRNYVTFQGKKHLILPGMVASVDILTGHRTLLHYILKPFMRVREAALIER